MKEMKRSVLFFALMFSTIMSFAQAESAEPTFGVTLEREVAFAIIEKEHYFDVVVELKAAEFADMFVQGVKVTIKDVKTGKKIYKKRFSKSYLYAFSEGTIQVGKGNALIQLVLSKSTESGEWHMQIKEKGIY